MLRYLLDTNIAIYVMRQTPQGVLERFKENSSAMALSSISVAELMFGAEKSSAPARNLAAIDEFCSELEVLEYGWSAAAHYGNIRATLQQAGTPIGNNDLHIAAHARSRGMTLVSNNLREFVRVPGLLMENWVENRP
jgi:tRNA(fMet)-specific endonuclease VapC